MFLSCEADGYLLLLFLIVPTTLIENSQLLQERNAGEEIVNEQFHYMYWETCLLCRFIVYSKAIICCNPNLASGGCFNTAYLFGGDVQYWLWSASDMILTSVGVVTRFVRNLESHGIL